MRQGIDTELHADECVKNQVCKLITHTDGTATRGNVSDS